MKLPTVILVTGTDTGVGKTITTAALTAALHARGRKVAVYKPCQSGNVLGDSDCAEVARLADPLTAEAGVVLEEPMAPVPAAALDGVTLPPLAAHAQRIRELSVRHDHVLVEGAGGLLVELDHDGGTLADLGAHLGDKAGFAVVARPALGTLNHTALTLEALDTRALPVVGLVLGSWPATASAVELSNLATLRSWPVPFLGTVPADASGLDPAAFRARACDWLEELPA
ncbi:8-amino-7-oxononanoate synthase/dethiobiotin synthetase [Pseudarthrobacter sp. PvP004]|uniref:dethiobiotin synthase n=1 Tax=Pseudarthrobacter sp. PvP004 TaxID=2817850 RepID=UPI001AE21CFD|nr:dethiobiotin synthase [Pseudarthrobacter sp. PvP004]MBP2267122.1 8-amino-7-oxononanoate synthase/dethiobiotin synthetase [Pseudarthrobacter sp. PvP004]